MSACERDFQTNSIEEGLSLLPDKNFKSHNPNAASKVLKAALGVVATIALVSVCAIGYNAGLETKNSFGFTSLLKVDEICPADCVPQFISNNGCVYFKAVDERGVASAIPYKCFHIETCGREARVQCDMINGANPSTVTFVQPPPAGHLPSDVGVNMLSTGGMQRGMYPKGVLAIDEEVQHQAEEQKQAKDEAMRLQAAKDLAESQKTQDQIDAAYPTDSTQDASKHLLNDSAGDSSSNENAPTSPPPSPEDILAMRIMAAQVVGGVEEQKLVEEELQRRAESQRLADMNDSDKHAKDEAMRLQAVKDIGAESQKTQDQRDREFFEDFVRQHASKHLLNDSAGDSSSNENAPAPTPPPASWMDIALMKHLATKVVQQNMGTDSTDSNTLPTK